LSCDMSQVDYQMLVAPDICTSGDVTHVLVAFILPLSFRVRVTMILKQITKIAYKMFSD